MPSNAKAAAMHIVIYKNKRTLKLMDGRRTVKTYKVALGKSPRGDKEVEGDGRTPEGEFYIFIKNDGSKFYLSLGLSYPNAEDARRGLKKKLITGEEHDAIVDAIGGKTMPPQKTALGGEIYIHGGGTAGDWTDGCIALADADIKELFDAATVGMKVLIKP
jgi:murein L,D-transpeptidase YafK